MKTLTKITSHIAQIRQTNETTMQEVCRLLMWSEAEYCAYLFEQYCLFVNESYKNHPDIIGNQVLYSPLFRGVFNNAASMRDEYEFLPYAADVIESISYVDQNGELRMVDAVPIGGDYLIDEWKMIHSYKRLLCDGNFLAQFNHVLKLIKIL